MSNAAMIAFILDGIILIFLSATIWFCWTLSQKLDYFRKTRSQLDKLVQDLAAQVNNANTAILNLKETASDADDRLGDLVSQARGLSDELQFINEAGNNLAERLERLASKNREIANKIDHLDAPAASYEETLKRRDKSPAEDSFAIQDRELDAPESQNTHEPEMPSDDENGANETNDDQPASKAERDLLQALKRMGRGKRDS